jgi:O-antigen/teichoic acid export membrane protein
MGIIRKQSFVSSIYIYLGFAIGALNTMYFFPKYFTAEEFGLTKLLTEVAMLIGMFCTLGSGTATVKFFPFYKSYLPARKNDLPFITILVCIIGCLLFISITPFCKELIIRKFSRNSLLFVRYFHLIYPLTIGYAFWLLLESIQWSLHNSMLTNFLKEVGFRFITTLLIVIYMLGLVGFNQFIILFSGLYLIPVLILIMDLQRKGYFNFTFRLSKVTKRLGKYMLTFSLFIFSGQMVALIARTSDTILISGKSENGLTDTAVFTIATFLIALMEVPQRSMMGIAVATISYAWKDKDMKKIEDMYKKTALTLTILGLGIGCAIFLNADNLVKYFGDKYAALPMLIMILGIAKLIDLGTGLNSQILLSSKYWRIDFGTNMLLLFLSIPFNFYLISKIGVVGSAYATLISTIIYNLVRMIFILKLFGIWPYTFRSFLPLIIAAAAFVAAYFIPVFENFIIDAVIRTSVFAGIYTVAIIKLKASSDINGLYHSLLERTRLLSKKK